MGAVYKVKYHPPAGSGKVRKQTYSPTELTRFTTVATFKSNKTLNRLMLLQSFFCTAVTDVAVAAADAVQQRSAGDTELPHCASDGCVGAHPAPVGEGESVARPGASACGKTTDIGM